MWWAWVFLVVFVVGSVVIGVARVRQSTRAELDAGRPAAQVRREVALLVAAVVLVVGIVVVLRHLE